MLGIFLDQETSGLDPSRHHVLEVALKVLDLKTGEEIAAYEAVVKHPFAMWQGKDSSSIVVNGFTWEMVSSGKELSIVREEIIALLTKVKFERGNGVFICQNPAFDRSFFSEIVDIYMQERLRWPYHWLDFASMYFALKVKESKVPTETELSKNAIAKKYDIPPEADPHRAMNGVNHLLLCYKTVVGFSG